MISDGLLVVAKRDCPTCTILEGVFSQLNSHCEGFEIHSQDDPTFPSTVANVRDDRSLETSFRLGIEIVPTLVRMKDGQEVARCFGWHREEWETLSGVKNLDPDLPDSKPGCGSKSVEPGIEEALTIQFGAQSFQSRMIEVSDQVDPMEVCFDRGWSDGLPVVPPTRVRVLRMLRGSTRDGAEELGLVPPALAPCTVEKVAINAVLAGCKPEYFPVVLAAVEAILDPAFAMLGVLATTDFASPIVIVSGVASKRIGMNSGVNALGQGCRANATIGRAVQLVVRNIGGGLPGGVDRATLGHPGKFTFCIAEDESDADWEPLRVDRGFGHETSTVTMFAGGGVHGIWTDDVRTPLALVKRKAAWLKRIGFPDAPGHAILMITPEHYRIYRDAGWNRKKIKQALVEASDGAILEEGLLLVRAGGPAGLQAAVMSGWGVGEVGSNPITKEIHS